MSPINILADRIFLHDRQPMMDFATKHRLPSVAAYRGLVEAGGLMSFGPSYKDMHRRAAGFIGKILSFCHARFFVSSDCSSASSPSSS